MVQRGLSMYEGPSADSRLARLGLEKEWLIEAARAAAFEKSNTTKFEPTTAGGSKAWFSAHRAFGEQASTKGWRKVEIYNLPRWVSPRGDIAVAIVLGDQNTGSRDLTRPPRSKSPRGIRSVFLVDSNERQLKLLYQEPQFRRVEENDIVTYWLLINVDDETVRAELSLAIGLDEENRLCSYKERIFFDIDRSDPLARIDGDSGDLPEPDVLVSPKRAL